MNIHTGLKTNGTMPSHKAAVQQLEMAPGAIFPVLSVAFGGRQPVPIYQALFASLRGAAAGDDL